MPVRALLELAICAAALPVLYLFPSQCSLFTVLYLYLYPYAYLLACERAHSDHRLGYVESSPATRICCPLPFYHTFGNTLVVLSMSTSLNTVVVPSEFFHAEDALRAVQAEKCNALHGTPTMLIDLLHHPRLAHYDLSSLRTSALGGAPVPAAVALAAAEKLHLPIVMARCCSILCLSLRMLSSCLYV